MEEETDEAKKPVDDETKGKDYEKMKQIAAIPLLKTIVMSEKSSWNFEWKIQEIGFKINLKWSYLDKLMNRLMLYILADYEMGPKCTETFPRRGLGLSGVRIGVFHIWSKRWREWR